MGRRIVLGVLMSVVANWGVGYAWTVSDDHSLELASEIGPVEASLRETFGIRASEMVSEGDVSPKKSPKKAFFLSAILPGGGQFYNGALGRAGIFFGLEAIAWTGYLLWTKKGGDIEEDYEAFADAHWSAEEYLVWKQRYVDTTGDTSHFTHRLPRDTEGNVLKTQQYYEMIGKYHQFRAGWDDYPEELRTTYVDSVWEKEGGARDDYLQQREDSNRYLKRAGYALGAVLVNHVISAIEAAKYLSSESDQAARPEEGIRVRAALWRDEKDYIPAIVVSKRF